MRRASRGAICGEAAIAAAVVEAGIDYLGNFKALGQKTNAPIYFAQALFAVQIVTILRAITIAGRPMHDINDFGALVLTSSPP